MAQKGLFNKVKSPLNRRRYVISTICKGQDLFETAVFEANFFYFPRSLSKPEIAVQTHTKDEAWDLHYLLASRLLKEYPVQVFEDYR